MTTPPGPSLIENEMFDAIREFFEREAIASHKVEAEKRGGATERRLQLATTVLFLQVIAADRGETAEEQKALPEAISRVLGIDLRDASIILDIGQKYVKTPLLDLLRVLNDRCSPDQRRQVVEGMWRLAFADAELAGHEEYFVRKVANALGLSTTDLAETRAHAREAFLGSAT